MEGSEQWRRRRRKRGWVGSLALRAVKVSCRKRCPMLTLKNAKGGEEEEEEGLFKADTVRRRFVQS